jgi:hypothetical protein
MDYQTIFVLALEQAQKYGSSMHNTTRMVSGITRHIHAHRKWLYQSCEVHVLPNFTVTTVLLVDALRPSLLCDSCYNLVGHLCNGKIKLNKFVLKNFETD